MTKWLWLLVMACSLNLAHANDGGIAIVDVLGVAPAQGVSHEEIKIYGGDTSALMKVMPISSVQKDWRSLAFLSDLWAVLLDCGPDYNRPTDNSPRHDFMCTFSLRPRAEWQRDNNEEIVDWQYPAASKFFTFNGPVDRGVLGIVPASVSGAVFSFYGEKARFFGQRLPPMLSFQSAGHFITITCRKTYNRSSNGELRHDWMCTVYSNSK